MSVSRVTVNKWWNLIIENEQEDALIHEEADRMLGYELADTIYQGAGHFGTPEEELAAIEP